MELLLLLVTLPVGLLLAAPLIRLSREAERPIGQVGIGLALVAALAFATEALVGLQIAFDADEQELAVIVSNVANGLFHAGVVLGIGAAVVVLARRPAAR